MEIYAWWNDSITISDDVVWIVKIPVKEDFFFGKRFASLGLLTLLVVLVSQHRNSGILSISGKPVGMLSLEW